ncbi:uncharacterized protein LOC126427919 isoform X1 [Schistocerca serialis cubense]|uniref:uncharacterized protein LOC126427919 isoform X1 n=1 Tax=Schistocerca serialis cubense TaxID=2023355 RepID=UPI00214E6EFE|nr:uncharacterized protein LOC126427919 isoform X1 [Schistocerca serialis cubense]
MEDSELAFLNIIKDYAAIISKSQTLAARREKADCIKEIQHRYMVNFGKEITDGQIMKKLHNMKSRIKAKTDVNKMGNIKISLKTWEQIFLKFLDGDDCNPTIHRVPGACAVGGGSTSVITSPRNSEVADTDCMYEQESILQLPLTVPDEHMDLVGPEVVIPSQSPASGHESVHKRRRLCMETDETRNLPTPELQRLMLLYQLDILKRNQQKLMRKEDKQ